VALVEAIAIVKPASMSRIMLWSAPRCTSTLFEHAIRLLPGVHGLHEPFSCAFYLGEERSSPRYAGLPPLRGYRRQEISAQLTCNYPPAHSLFVKDMAYAIESDYRRLPREFLHTFLIRDPRQSIVSLYRLLQSAKAPQWSEFIPLEAGFRDLHALYAHVARDGAEPIVVDSADLLAKPAATLQAYCEAVGLTYDDRALSWDSSQASEQWQMWGTEWYESLMNSSGFTPSGGAGRIDLSGLPAVVRESIDDALPLYDWLRERRLRSGS
jgi:hypothetical protein